MKLILITIFCLLGIAIAQTGDDAKREERIFNQWLKNYNVDVPPDADLKKWKENVIKNFKEVEAHNSQFRKGEKKFRKALNSLAHMTPEERKTRLYGFEAYPEKPSEYKFVPVVDPALLKDFPDYWDWRDHGILQPVQNQNPCGSCYIFATIALIEAHACLYKDSCNKLSEQEALDCSEGRGCGGGTPEVIYNYTIKAGGAAYEKDYPYQKKPIAACDTSKRPRVPGTKVLDWKFLPNDPETIRYYLKTQGPLFMGVAAYKTLHNVGDGIYDDPGDGTNEGHSILCVGYGTEKDGTKYWIMRNSWGPNWADNGYFKMIRGVDFANCESNWPGFPIMA